MRVSVNALVAKARVCLWDYKDPLPMMNRTEKFQIIALTRHPPGFPGILVRFWRELEIPRKLGEVTSGRRPHLYGAITESAGRTAVKPPGTTRATACPGLRPRCPAAGFRVRTGNNPKNEAVRGFRPSFRRGRRKQHARRVRSPRNGPFLKIPCTLDRGWRILLQAVPGESCPREFHPRTDF